MANYMGFTRTNYFRVTDEDELKRIVGKMGSYIELWTENVEGETFYGFGCYESIGDACDDETGECYSFDSFAEELKRILHKDDVVIIKEIGYEKLRYLSAYAIVITPQDIKTVDLDDSIANTVAELTGSSDHNIACEY